MASKALLLLFSVCFSQFSYSQQNTDKFSILFYNVENLFDTHDNPETEDNYFTPEGEYRWTGKRLNLKLLNISKAILSSSGWSVPDIILFCEIENREILEKLIKITPLKSYPYKIVHKDSPDHRGIDVGMIYNAERFNPIEYNYYPVEMNGKKIETREILYVSGVVCGTDTLHVFGNHWPSRYSGFMETKSFRNAAAKLLKTKVDELYKKYKSPKIVIMGDFNDNPEDESLFEVLMAKKVEESILENHLYNLFFDSNRVNSGTMKYQSQWFIFDQIIVSGSLLTATSGISTTPENAKITALPFLFEYDEKFGGKKPFRTYYGFSYNGGFSDHLPVLLELNLVN
ncbi:MAG: endonuclease [Bacteroidetes bacterium]|nr:MAG: endonuclease [Bacteroidota bacterium]